MLTMRRKTTEQRDDLRERISHLETLVSSILQLTEAGDSSTTVAEIKDVILKTQAPKNEKAETSESSNDFQKKKRRNGNRKKKMLIRQDAGDLFEAVQPDVELDSATPQRPPSRKGSKSKKVLSEKILIPTEPADVNYIGRILGPKGLSVRELENKTNSRIVIQGRGSVRDPVEEERLRSRPGYEHLCEPLHIRVTVNDYGNHALAEQRLNTAREILEHLLIVKNDLYKQRQLVQHALMNGTYRPHHSIMKMNTANA